jgi:hypothetical protein
MTRLPHAIVAGVVLAACTAASACALRRPDTPVVRMLEPQLVEMPAAAPAPGAIPIRLLDTAARSHIGRRLLHRRADGELVEDRVWRWTSRPDRYLDSALRLALASSPGVTLVDAGAAPTMAVTLLEWDLDESSEGQLAGALEIETTDADRVVRTEVVRRTQPVSAELPGNLAQAAGRLLHDLASDCVARATHHP